MRNDMLNEPGVADLLGFRVVPAFGEEMSRSITADDGSLQHYRLRLISICTLHFFRSKRNGLSLGVPVWDILFLHLVIG